MNDIELGTELVVTGVRYVYVEKHKTTPDMHWVIENSDQATNTIPMSSERVQEGLKNVSHRELAHTVSIKVSENKFGRFYVPRHVALYIRQLEIKINNPDESKLFDLYPKRFARGIEAS